MVSVNDHRPWEYFLKPFEKDSNETILFWLDMLLTKLMMFGELPQDVPWERLVERLYTFLCDRWQSADKGDQQIVLRTIHALQWCWTPGLSLLVGTNEHDVPDLWKFDFFQAIMFNKLYFLKEVPQENIIKALNQIVDVQKGKIPDTRTIDPAYADLSVAWFFQALGRYLEGGNPTWQWLKKTQSLLQEWHVCEPDATIKAYLKSIMGVIENRLALSFQELLTLLDTASGLLTASDMEGAETLLVQIFAGYQEKKYTPEEKEQLTKRVFSLAPETISSKTCFSLVTRILSKIHTEYSFSCLDTLSDYFDMASIVVSNTKTAWEGKK